MRNRRSALPATLALLGVLGAARLSAAELRGRVVGKDGKQGLEGVVVQAFCDGRLAASGDTNASGRFLLSIPDGIDLRASSLMVTRQPIKVKTVRLQDGRNASITAPTAVLAMQSNPSFKADNVLRANVDLPAAHPKNESSH